MIKIGKIIGLSFESQVKNLVNGNFKILSMVTYYYVRIATLSRDHK